MTVLSAQTIRRLQPITPFHERTVHNGMTFGLSTAGYDVRIAEDIKLSSPSRGVTFHTVFGRSHFSLASTVEQFDIPDDCLAYVKDKSSWARKGLSVFNTVIEPGWKGFLTLELVYHGNGEMHIPAGSPIAQIVFHKLDEPTEQPYNGKYQNQRAGAVPAIMAKE